MGEDGKSPLNIHVGAKASLELKGEIPKESLGRTLDSLVDLIRPFTEARGLKADNIRLQRTEVAYKIAKMTREAAELENVALIPPPTKFFVPFLEKASLEDRDEELHSRWSTLLLSASTHYDARHLTFIDVMSRLSSDEIKLLEEVCLSNPQILETFYPDGHTVVNQHITTEFCGLVRKQLPPVTTQDLRRVFDNYVGKHPLAYGRVMFAKIYNAGYVLFATDYGVPRSQKHRSLEILEHEKLIGFRTSESVGTGVTVGYFDLTPLGIAFVEACSPLARGAIKDHEGKI
jgi:hypothetical protein